MSDGRRHDVDPRIGWTLGGKWRLERKLGEGGMGAVYAAIHVRNGKRAAIKILGAHSDRTGALFARFRREARIAALLERSGGVVEVFDDDVCDDGSPYIVMELLHGEDYDAIARRAGGRLPAPDVVAMADAVLLVLSEAHRRGVVHRDLKPANVFRTTEGRIKVLDFGIAALKAEADEMAGGAAPLTQPSTPMMGSIGFMPPEQARGEWESLDGRSDLWAVGATMFALLGGRTVHAATSARQELVRTMLDEPASLASVAPDAPEWLCRVVDRALAFDRGKRWPDAAAMRAALLASDAEATDPLAATQEAPLVPAPPPPRVAASITTGVAFGSGTTSAVEAAAARPLRNAALLIVGLAVVGGVAALVLGPDDEVVPATRSSGASASAHPGPAPPTRAPDPSPDVAVVITAEPIADEPPAPEVSTRGGPGRGGPRPRASASAPPAASSPPSPTSRTTGTPAGDPPDLDRRR